MDKLVTVDHLLETLNKISEMGYGDMKIKCREEYCTRTRLLMII